MSSETEYMDAPEGPVDKKLCPVFAKAVVDGYHIATMRADLKKSVVITVKLFERVNKIEVKEVGPT